MAASLDRTQLVEKAAAHLQRGELDKALSHYVSLFKRDPGDWNIANTLGDLYVRVGKASDAVDHFSALAERLASDGFTAKARALYRKILRIQPHNTTARLRVDELEKPVGGSSPFLQRVLETARTARESRHAEPAAPAEDAAHQQVTPPPAAVEAPAARAVPEPPPEPAQPPPVDVPVAAPAPEPRAAIPLVRDEWNLPEHRATSPDGEIALELSSATVSDVVGPPAAPPATMPLDVPHRSPVAPIAPVPRTVGDEYRDAEAAADAAAARHEFTVAAAAIERFLSAHPQHIPALEKLIDVGVDGGLEATLNDAQVRLAEACLEAGNFDRARDIAVDLIFRDPGAERFSALLDRVLAAAKAGARAMRTVPLEVLMPEAESEPAPPLQTTVVRFTPIEQPAAAAVETRARDDAQPEEWPADLREWSDPDRAFDELRTTVLEEAAAAAEERVADAERLVAARQYQEAVCALEEAMCAPHLRGPAGARLACLYRDIGTPMEALACLEWVAEVPPASADHGHELAYELAVTLEALGQQVQALGIYRELLAEVGSSYRDIAIRTERIAAA